MANVILNHFNCQRCSRISNYANACRHCTDAPSPNPWVVVGTTTIDGTFEQVNALFGVNTIGKTTSLGPTLVGGRMLKPTGWHLNRNLSGEALVFCDIVRRQSEIDAEDRTTRHTCVGCGAPAEWVFCPACSDEAKAMEKAKSPCSECGPHGNRGEVLLASSWAKCTTCAGGKSGDLWGEVEARPDILCSIPGCRTPHLPGDVHAQVSVALSSALISEGASSEVAQKGVRAFLDVLNRPTSAHQGANLKSLSAYADGDHIVDRWGRTGVVMPFDGPKAYVRARMDEGWLGTFTMTELAGKASE